MFSGSGSRFGRWRLGFSLRERAWPWRFAVSAAFAFVLFFCHLFAAGLYGLGLLALELHRLWLRRNEPWAPRLAEFVANGIPFCPLSVLLVASPTWNAPGSPAFWEFSGKLQGLVAVFNVYYLPSPGSFLQRPWRVRSMPFRRGILKFNAAGWAILAVGCIAYLACLAPCSARISPTSACRLRLHLCLWLVSTSTCETARFVRLPWLWSRCCLSCVSPRSKWSGTTSIAVPRNFSSRSRK
jgi:hypothetical protein